jgi:transposase
MLVSLLVPQLSGLRLDSAQLEGQQIVVTMTATSPTASCPVCAQESDRVHSHYQRTVLDLPWAGQIVQLRLHVRRFRCPNPNCLRAIFAERLDGVVRASARRSERLSSQLLHLALRLASEAAAPVLTALGMPASAATLLRLQRRASPPAHGAPRVIGVDEFAFRKGRRYGAMIVDLERQQPIELLPDKQADTFASWLQEHPQVEVISRDRDGAFAEGAAVGAPQATQVADRWHLTQNLGDALQRLLARHPAALRAAAQTPDRGNAAEAHDDRTRDDSVAVVIPTPAPVLPDRLPTEREQRFQEVLTLHDQGWSSRLLAQTLQLNWRTVKRYVQARELPKRGAPSIQPISTLTPYLAYLQQRWQDGVQTGTVLWQELQQRGYTGSLSSVYRALKYLHPADGRGSAAATASTGVSRRALSARQAMWVLVRADDELTEQERKARVTLETADPVIAAATSLAGQFLQLIRQRDAVALDQWLGDAAASGVAELSRFAASLRRDYAAVRAALELPWSQGQVEGQINRLKVIKRVGYGRAKFDLLRQRVLVTS